MSRTRLRLAAAVGLLALGAAACGGSSVAPRTAQPGASGSSAATDYAAVEAAAKGQTVNWYMYGAIDELNGFVNGYVADQLKAKGITLNQVKITDTAEAVNKVLAEKQAGKDTDGAVDMIWINGENFATLKQAELLLLRLRRGPAEREVRRPRPARRSPTTSACRSTGCETPWQQANSGVVYNSEKVARRRRLASVSTLFDWAKAHPGRFTYPAPPDFTGSMAVRTFFYDTAGGPDQFLGAFDEAKYATAAAKTWQRLNDLEPSLYRQGKTYPQGGTDVVKLFADGEIDAYLTYDTGATGAKVDRRLLPGEHPHRGVRRRQHRQLQLPRDPVQRRAQGGRDGAGEHPAQPRGADRELRPEGRGLLPGHRRDEARRRPEGGLRRGAGAGLAAAPGGAAREDAARGGQRLRDRLEKDWTANVLQK